MSIQSNFSCVLSPYIGEEGKEQFDKVELKQSELALLSLDGNSYVAPALSMPSLCTFIVEVNINGVDVCDSDELSTVYVDKDEEVKINVQYNLISSEGDKDQDDIYTMLYKVGESSPIAISKNHAEDFDTCDFEMDTAPSTMAEGHYFLLIGNVMLEDADSYDKLQKVGPYMLLPFEIVTRENNVARQVKGVAVEAEMLNDQSKVVMINLTLDKELDGNHDCKIVCYDSDYNFMGSSVPIVEQNVWEFVVLSNHIWAAGEYKAVVVKKQQLIAGVCLTVDEDGGVSATLSPDGDEVFSLLAYATGVSTMEQASKVCGYSSMYKYALEACRFHRVNKAREDAGFSMLVPTRVMACVGQYTPDLRTMINAVSDLLTDACATVYDASSFVLSNQDEDSTPFSTSKGCFEDDDDHEYVIYNLSYLASPEASTTMGVLSSRFERNEIRFLALVGTREELEEVKSRYAFIKENLHDRDVIDVSDVDPNVAMMNIETEMDKLSLHLTKEARAKILNTLVEAHKAGEFTMWTCTETKTLIQSITNRMAQRLSLHENISGNDVVLLRMVLPEDVELSRFGKADNTESYEQCAAELNSMIGLETVKRNMLQAANMARFNLLRSKNGFKGKFNGCHHMVFTGNPGTGKTTVAKLVGRIYRSLGLLSKGDVVVTERSKIVGRYIGETEKNMRELLNKAKGNVLFIDEAYTLITDDDDTRDYGRRVIESLLTVLSQQNPDMIIIFAGYKSDIDRLFQVNQGLRGRFPIELEFEDYDAGQLYQIAKRVIDQEGFILDGAADVALREAMQKAYDNRDKNFSNARWAEQFVHNGIIVSMASRVMVVGKDPDETQLVTITKSDVEAAENLSKSSKASQRRRIGF